MPRTDAAAGDAAVALMRLANLITRDLGRRLEPLGITAQQWAVLTTLARSEESPTLATLARAMSVSKQNMTGMVSRLEELGFVRRKGHETDLRASSLELTAKGEKVISRSDRAVGSWAGEVFGSLRDADRKALPRSVQALVSTLETR